MELLVPVGAVVASTRGEALVRIPEGWQLAPRGLAPSMVVADDIFEGLRKQVL